MSKDLDEDLSVRLLADVRVIFDRRPTVDRLPSAAIVAELVDLADGRWSEWRGLQDDRMPRRLTQVGLALMLAPFGIRPKTIWPPRRGATDKIEKGYRREQFEAAWASYCDGTCSISDTCAMFRPVPGLDQLPKIRPATCASIAGDLEARGK